MNKRSTTTTRTFARPVSGLALAVFFICLVAGIGLAVVFDQMGLASWVSGLAVTAATLQGLYLLAALKVASEWEKAVLLRAGKFRGLRGPGLFWVVPVLDTIPVWIDHRVMVTPFNAEKTLTKEATHSIPRLIPRSECPPSARFHPA
jgi:hypothetical protein